MPQLLLQARVWPGQQARSGTEQLPSEVPLQGRVPFSPQLLLHERSPQQVLATEQAPYDPFAQARVPAVPQLLVQPMVSPGQQARMGTGQAPQVIPLQVRFPFSPQLLLHAGSPQQVSATEHAP